MYFLTKLTKVDFKDILIGITFMCMGSEAKREREVFMPYIPQLFINNELWTTCWCWFRHILFTCKIFLLKGHYM